MLRPPSFACGETDGGDQVAVGVGRGRIAVFSGCSPEGAEHDQYGDAVVGLDAWRVGGVVIEPGDDLGVRTFSAARSRPPSTSRAALKSQPSCSGTLILKSRSSTTSAATRW